MLNVEVIPIKTLTWSNNWISTNPQLHNFKNQKQKNSKNFLFMRVTNHSKKKSLDQKNKLESKKSKSSYNAKQNTEPRPKTTLLLQRNNEQTTRNSFLFLPKENPEIESILKPRITKRYYTPCNQLQSEHKNYFPQRKPKKNRDQKWHDYYTLLNIKEFTIDYCEPCPVHPSSTRKQRDLAKLGKTLRTRTPVPEHRKYKIREKQPNSHRQIISELSPWNTETAERIHHHENKGLL